MLSQAKVDEVRILLANGLGYRATARKVGVSHASVHNIATDRPMVFTRHGEEKSFRQLRRAVRCKGCGAKINVAPCVRCMAAQNR